MNCQPKSLSIQAILKSVPTGSGEFTPDKPIKKGLRWSKTSGRGHDGGTVDEAGTSNPSGRRGCQQSVVKVKNALGAFFEKNGQETGRKVQDFEVIEGAFY